MLFWNTLFLISKLNLLFNADSGCVDFIGLIQINVALRLN